MWNSSRASMVAVTTRAARASRRATSSAGSVRGTVVSVMPRSVDEAAQRIFRNHHDLLAETSAAHGGHEVKWLGDGLMVAFSSAADGLRCALAMQRAARRPVHGEQLAIRVGINAGEALQDDEADYFGLSVVVARRLCDRA